MNIASFLIFHQDIKGLSVYKRMVVSDYMHVLQFLQNGHFFQQRLGVSRP